MALAFILNVDWPLSQHKISVTARVDLTCPLTRMQIFVRAERTYTLDVESIDSVAHAKTLINAKTGFPIPSQRLIYTGYQLSDAKTLAGTFPWPLTFPFPSQPC